MNKAQNKLMIFFEEGSKKFFNEERINILARVSERNLCGRLAMILESLLMKYKFEGYFCDVEYNRKQNGKIKTILDDKYRIINITCDLIVHSRGQFFAEDNLLAIEMKKSTRPDDEKNKDRNRLRALTKSKGVYSLSQNVHPKHVCGYKLGIFFEIDVKNKVYLIEIFANGKQRKKDTLRGEF